MICCLNFIAQLIVYGCFQIFYRFFINDIVVDNLIAIVYGFWQTFYFFIIDSDLVKLPAFVCLSFYTFSAQRIWIIDPNYFFYSLRVIFYEYTILIVFNGVFQRLRFFTIFFPLSNQRNIAIYCDGILCCIGCIIPFPSSKSITSFFWNHTGNSCNLTS